MDTPAIFIMRKKEPNCRLMCQNAIFGLLKECHTVQDDSPASLQSILKETTTTLTRGDAPDSCEKIASFKCKKICTVWIHHIILKCNCCNGNGNSIPRSPTAARYGPRAIKFGKNDFCTVMTVSKFQNDGLDRQFTASTVRPYFDGSYRQTVIAQPCVG